MTMRKGRKRLSLATRSDLSIEAQVTAPGATWIDRQLLAGDPDVGKQRISESEVHESRWNAGSIISSGEGLARRQGQRVIFARDLLNTLRQRDSTATVARLSAETGLLHQPSVGRRRMCRRLSSARDAGVRPVCHD